MKIYNKNNFITGQPMQLELIKRKEDSLSKARYR